mmetsp:Transcript_4726/g.11649  ORF Transcript_4726/g.11649 Transcript_4726/m.11649 type:complete len:292 (+) Transcript_4726:189-1064(+)
MIPPNPLYCTEKGNRSLVSKRTSCNKMEHLLVVVTTNNNKTPPPQQLLVMVEITTTPTTTPAQEDSSSKCACPSNASPHPTGKCTQDSCGERDRIWETQTSSRASCTQGRLPHQSAQATTRTSPPRRTQPQPQARSHPRPFYTSTKSSPSCNPCPRRGTTKVQPHTASEAELGDSAHHRRRTQPQRRPETRRLRRRRPTTTTSRTRRRRRSSRSTSCTATSSSAAARPTRTEEETRARRDASCCLEHLSSRLPSQRSLRRTKSASCTREAGQASGTATPRVLTRGIVRARR